MNQRILIVCALCILVLVGATATGDLSGADPQHQDDPVFLVVVNVGPATGAMYIPPADPPSRPYRANAVVRWRHEKAEHQTRLASGEFYAGDELKKNSDLDPYEVVMSVEVDRRGEQATVFIDVFRNDDGAQVLGQRFFCALPASQILP